MFFPRELKLTRLVNTQVRLVTPTSWTGLLWHNYTYTMTYFITCNKDIEKVEGTRTHTHKFMFEVYGKINQINKARTKNSRNTSKSLELSKRIQLITFCCSINRSIERHTTNYKPT